ncbi:uncharacterized protein LOC129220912 [Uloborus diversus]|uniref:uncharacterized protein LOC129220912 n=1 Tax=Uloborus diversus TaxID=327109 RepID=UPI0024090F0E|nr:uncharacterized protein LOC129220912 [Uloborus diversus]
MKSFITQELANKLDLEVIRKEKLSVYTFGITAPIQKTYDVIRLVLEHRSSPNSRIEVELLVTDHILGSDIPPPKSKEIRQNKLLRNLILADSLDSQQPVGILIGADYYYNIVTGHIKRLNKNLVAVETIFGWSLQGREGEDNFTLSFNVIFESDVVYEDCRYKVKLPWKSDTSRLDDNREIAEQRFNRLRNRFKKNPQLFSEYQNIIQDYLKQNIIEPVTDETDKENIVFYLPHGEVIREDRTTSKLRIVFDASSHDSNSESLNDCLHVGPNLYPEIFEILLRFRYYPVAFTADIKQAFLQILLDKEDRDVTRFFSTDSPTSDNIMPLVYRFSTILFGLNSSSFLLSATLKHHFKKYKQLYPETVSILENNVYVDDVILSRDTVREALTTSLETIHIFKEASMQLHKWHTNSRELHELWKKEGIISNANFQISDAENTSLKVLGMAWDNSRDLLYFDIRSLLSFLSKPIETKRFILQVLGRIFDPIGILGPFTVRIKLLIQKIWASHIDWDEPLPEDLISLWRKCLCLDIGNIELHCFSDASTVAYGTVAYLRFKTNDKEIQTTFIASKNRVTPLKILTLPRLELMGALLSAKLGNNIVRILNLNIPCYFWTDSSITYFWIKKQPDAFKPFVKNRVQDIQKLTSPNNWGHCRSCDNPADLVSRGAKISKLINEPLWTQGPPWLRLSPDHWPKLIHEKIVEESQLEYRKKSLETHELECIVENREDPVDLSKYSDLEKLLMVTAWTKRFIAKLRKSSNIQGALITEELQEAENLLIRCEQKRHFGEELKSLSVGNSVEKNSPLYNFAPYIDEKQVMRLGGRLEFSEFSLDNKHPVILPTNSALTRLIVLKEHEKKMHGGTSATLAKFRSRFGIPKGRQLIKKIIKKCLICQKYLAKPADQLTAPLPKDRIQESPPFSICGIDFAGPVYVKNYKDMQKSYIVLFTCAVTRAVHLELVSNMSTQAFLLVFRRFLTKERTQWKYIIERAAWWGGFYERLVKSVKECLRKVIGKALLTFEEMTTLLTEVETVLNSRPLSYTYNEIDEPEALTPLHFLNYAKNDHSYPVHFSDLIAKTSPDQLRRRKEYQTKLLKNIWLKWKTQYLLDLRTVHRLDCSKEGKSLKIGDVVLLEGSNKNKFLWPLGIITELFKGRDGLVRACTVKTKDGQYRRPIQLVYPLEMINGQ